MKEKWEDIPGYFGEYQASTFGRVKDINNIILLEHRIRGGSAKSYLKPFDYYVSVTINGMRVLVHRIIAHTFVDGWSKERNIVDHIDKNKHNNYETNLRWVTPKENSNNKFPPFVNKQMYHMDILRLYIQYGLTLQYTARYTGFSLEKVRNIIKHYGYEINPKNKRYGNVKRKEWFEVYLEVKEKNKQEIK